MFNSHLAMELANLPAHGKAQAEAFLTAGVRADTLWRLRLMENPHMLNREGIEIVPVGVPGASLL